MEKMTRQKNDLISVFPNNNRTESANGRRKDKRAKPPKEKLMMKKSETLQKGGDVG